MQSKTYYPSRMKRLAILAGSLVFVVGGILMKRNAGAVMWFPIIFFGVCGIVGLLTFFPQSSFLKIEDEGFTFVAFFSRPQKFQWEDVDAFRVGKLGAQRVVVFDHRDREDQSVFARRETALPYAIGFSAKDLVRLLAEKKTEQEKQPIQSITAQRASRVADC